MRRILPFLVAGALVVASAALVRAGTEPTTYYACVNNASGTLRIATQTTCLKSEHMISWNSVGPQGPTGITGPAGPTGQGPGYVTDHYGESPDIAVYPDSSVIETLHGLPPGKYIVTAAAGFMADADIGWTKVWCALDSPGGQVYQSGLYWHYATMEEGRYSETDQIPLVAGFRTSETTDLSIVCGASDEGVVSLPSIISATRVTTLTVDSLP
jgi:hypothetical protein